MSDQKRKAFSKTLNKAVDEFNSIVAGLREESDELELRVIINSYTDWGEYVSEDLDFIDVEEISYQPPLPDKKEY